MNVEKISPPVTGFLKVRLDEHVIDYLWKIIEISKTKDMSFSNQLVGNISQSLLLDDLDSFFYKSICLPLIKYYREKNSDGIDPVSLNTILDNKYKFILNQFWVNYQYKTEFNPYHDHNGVYSFVIWLKIPYAWNDQKKLPQFRNMNLDNVRAGVFEFEYIDSLGGVKNLTYRLSPEYEGYMLFFPAKLRHCVYPFYGTDEARISISGNLSYLPS